jgi:hypothetical protein
MGHEGVNGEGNVLVERATDAVVARSTNARQRRRFGEQPPKLPVSAAAPPEVTAEPNHVDVPPFFSVC